MQITVHHSTQALCNIRKIEEDKGARFLLTTQLKTSGRQFTYQPYDLFYQPAPDTSKGHTHYFGVCPDYDHGHHVFFVKADMEDVLVNFMLVKGVLNYSAHRHDFSSNPNDPGVFIDGGREYFRGSNAPHGTIGFLSTGPQIGLWDNKVLTMIGTGDVNWLGNRLQ